MSAAPALALEASVPDFDVYIGADKLEFKNADYPLLLYRDVTYFPMTYDYVNWLGLTSSWIEGEFSIAYYNSSKVYYPTGSAVWQINPKTVTGELASYDIYVNSRKIDNFAEEYPIFNYGGITYFPMTWRFAVEEFGLDVYWDGAFHIEKNYPDVTFELYNVVGDKAYFEFYVPNSDGSITYSNESAVSAWFDARTGEFGLGEAGYPDEVWADAANLSVDGGVLKYGETVVADISGYAEGEELLCFGREQTIGDAVIVWAQVEKRNNGIMSPGVARYRPRRNLAFALKNDRPIMLADSGDDLRESFTIKKVQEIGGVIYISLLRGVDTLGLCYNLISLSDGGVVTRYADADHANMELVGEINGKPAVRATWQTADRRGSVSAVNDGVFIIEPDGRRSRVCRFVDSGACFTAANRIFLAIDHKGVLMDAVTGEEYDYLNFIAEQIRLRGI